MTACFPFRAHALVALLLAAATLRAEEADRRHLVKDPATQAVSMALGDTVCWRYEPVSREGKPYFHPLCIPGTAEAFTAFRPPDHAWHLGFWFSWKFINGVNFWEPDSNGVTRVVAQTVTPRDDQSLDIAATLAYVAKGLEALHEQRSVHVTTRPNGDYTIDWDTTFSAPNGPAELSATPAKKDKTGIWATGGYAGLLLRFADSPAFSYTYANDAGAADVKTCGDPSIKMTVIVTSAATGHRARLTFEDHPENPRAPTPWFARHSTTAHKGRGYYLMGPSVIFHEPLTIEPGKPLRFRYTLTVERL